MCPLSFSWASSLLPAMNSLRSSRVFFRPARIDSRLTRSHVRHFHPTKPAWLVNEALDVSAGFIHGVHSLTGLPWVVSIPLTAAIVRTVVALPLQIFVRVHARRERDLAPLVHSWRVLFQQRARERRDPEQARSVAMKDLASKSSELKSRWKVSKVYRPAGFLQVPIWISLMESLRAMCGNNNGLVPWLLSLVEPSTESASAAAESLHLTVEPSLANEGALWFPDLLAGDPTGILPALLTASILINVRTGWPATPALELADMPRLQMYQGSFFRGLRVFIQILALNIGFSSYFYGMPSALMLYWITSTNLATVQTALLEKYMFSRPPLPLYQRLHVTYKKPGHSDPFMTKFR